VPSLTSFRSAGTGDSNAYLLRGMGNAETAATIDPAVGTCIDAVCHLFVLAGTACHYVPVLRYAL